MRLLSSWILLAFIGLGSTFRLNVPRALLPFHDSVQVKYSLEVSQPTGGCFHWRSTRPDVVSVTPVGAHDCSDRAELTVTAKVLNGEMNAVIFANDRDSGSTLSCAITVDKIAEVRIETTTKVLFVDAAPVRMMVKAINKDGDYFSTLSGIPINWELAHSGAEKPLRIVNFMQSAYEAPQEIVALEKNKKKGYLVLVEGISTGSAILTAKFNDPSLKHIAPNNLDLIVVANLLLLPAHDLYVPLQAEVNFEVLIVRQQGTEVVHMPSPAHFLKVDSEKVCSLDTKSSRITALSRGSTEIHLLSTNVDLKAKTGVRPPSTIIHVVEPESLLWSVTGDNWILESGKPYTLTVGLRDSQGNNMHISDNLRFESYVNKDVFDILHVSDNQTHFVVSPKKAGKTKVTSRFAAVVNKAGSLISFGGKVRGEQDIQIVDPVRVAPRTVNLPYEGKMKSHFNMKAFGGSGLYNWEVANPSIIAIDSTQGIVTASSIGSTLVTASDKRNPALRDSAEVNVLEIGSLEFGKTRKEVDIGNILQLNVQLFGALDSSLLAIDDCRNVIWTVDVRDSSVFEHIKSAESILPTVGSGCGTLSLRAKAVGDTSVTVSLNGLKATVEVSAYPPLKLELDEVALGLGSDFPVSVHGGPRPWIQDPSHHFIRAADKKGISTTINDGHLLVKCGSDEQFIDLRISMGNAASSSLPLPVVFETSLSVCCSSLKKMQLKATRENSYCRSTAKILPVSGSIDFLLIGYGSCNSVVRRLDSISGYDVKWAVDKKDLLDLNVNSKSKDRTSIAGRGSTGDVSLSASAVSVNGVSKLEKVLSSSIDIRLVKPATPVPKKLVMLNDPGSASREVVKMDGGSGFFTVQLNAGSPFKAIVRDSQVEVSAISAGSGVLHISDSCVPEFTTDVPIRISNIASLAIEGPSFVEMGTDFSVNVRATNDQGEAFTTLAGVLDATKLEVSNANIQIVRRTGDQYVLRSLFSGHCSLIAKGSSTSHKQLTSRPHAVQIYTPISLEPKILTLIPESTFQLQVFGGPTPIPPLIFDLNNANVANVESNGLITSQTLGTTSISGSIDVATGHQSRDTVQLRVVSLAGIGLKVSSPIVERGGRVWLRLHGLDETETPFAFGGALYPFKVSWQVAHADILQVSHPFGEQFSEINENQFGLWLTAKSAGTTNIKVKVTLSPKAKHHFVGRNQEFEASTQIRVENPLALLEPPLTMDAVRIAPSCDLQLQSIWPSASVFFSVPAHYSSLLQVTESGLVRALSREGGAVISITRRDSSNETSLIPVQISRVNSLDIVSSSFVNSVSDGQYLYRIPVGFTIKLDVLFRDVKGRSLHGAPSKIAYRPHRFDLTEIVPVHENRTLMVTMKTGGETVLKIWDSSSPSLSVFVRLVARDALLPDKTLLVVSGILCTKSPISGEVSWHSPDNTLQWLDAGLGVARIVHAGVTTVIADFDDQKLYDKVSFTEPSSLVFSAGRPQHVTNIEGVVYEFPVNVGRNQSLTSDCNSEQLMVIDDLPAPFECEAFFASDATQPAGSFISVKSTFNKAVGKYCCVVEKQKGVDVSLSLPEMKENKLTIVAKWKESNEVSSAIVTLPFYFGMEAVEKEIHITNRDESPAIVSLIVPENHLGKISATTCEFVTLSEGKTTWDDNKANKFYNLKLSSKVSSVWNDVYSKCILVIENMVTKQKIEIPIRMKLIGESGTVIGGGSTRDDLLSQLILPLTNAIPFLMFTCFVGFIIVLGYRKAYSYLFEKKGYYNGDASMNQSAYKSPGRFTETVGSNDSSVFRNNSPFYRARQNGSFASSEGSSPAGRSNEDIFGSSPKFNRRF